MGNGAKNNKTIKDRYDILKNRNTENLRAFIYNHIKKNNNIIKGGLRAYDFLDEEYSDEIHIHEFHRHFCFLSHSTSHIKGVWGRMKDNIRKI